MADGKVMHFYRLDNADDRSFIESALKHGIDTCGANPGRLADWLLVRFSISRNVPFILSNDILDPQ